MKIDRLLAITILLLNRGRVQAKELAERFEVSTKTIYRDMDALSQAGIPITAVQGSSGGYEIIEGYTIERQFLTLREIGALQAVIKGVRCAVEGESYTSLLNKVEGLRLQAQSNQSGIPGTSHDLVVDLHPWGQTSSARSKLRKLQKAIEEKRMVSIIYSDRNGASSERVVEPAALVLKGPLWYMQAYCTLRGSFRVFRLSRITRLEITDNYFTTREAPKLDHYRWESEWYKEEKREVRLSFHPRLQYVVEERFPEEWIHVSDQPETEGCLHVVGEFVVDDWFYGMLLSYGDGVYVEGPLEIAEELTNRAQKIIDRYQSGP